MDYEEKFSQLEQEKQDRLTETGEMYEGMIDASKEYYQDQIEESQRWAAQQSALQQEKTDFAIEQIEQQKEQTKKDYTKEQSGAYADWQKESNRYSVNAEELAAGGLTNTGYGESSQVRMYNTYQNRVAAARESYNLAILNYNNAIREAQIQNNSALAEIAHAALQQQLELSLQGFQYENQLLMTMEGQKAQIEDAYYDRYLDVLNQMNTENALAEQARQYDLNYALKMKEYEEGVRQFDAEMARLKELDAEEKRQWDMMYTQSNAGIQKDEESNSKAEAVGAAVARNAIAGQVMSGYYPGKTTTNKDIMDFIEKNMPTTGNNSTSRYQQKLANDEKKLHGSDTKANSGMAGNVPIANAGITLGQNLILSKIENTLAKNTYAVATDYYRGELNPDASTYGTFANGYQPKGISGHGWLEKTGDTYTFYTTKQYGSQAGKTVQVKQNVWKAEDGTMWYWEGTENEYKPMPGV